MDEDQINFTVRPLPPGAALDGAFRAHIAVKDLDSLRVRPGQLVKLCTSEGNTGYAIAWRSNDQSTKAQTHPVKLTDSLREAFGFKLGNQLTITKATTQILHADRVVIVDVSDTDVVDLGKDDKSWKWRCGQILGMTLARIYSRNNTDISQATLRPLLTAWPSRLPLAKVLESAS